jgi:hypothetical protein
LGEKIENPDEDPDSRQTNLTRYQKIMISPIYLVSPQLLVTNEHIISDNSATSSAVFSGSGDFDAFLSGTVFVGSGDATKLRGVDSPASFGVL